MHMRTLPQRHYLRSARPPERRDLPSRFPLPPPPPPPPLFLPALLPPARWFFTTVPRPPRPVPMSFIGALFCFTLKRPSRKEAELLDLLRELFFFPPKPNLASLFFRDSLCDLSFGLCVAKKADETQTSRLRISALRLDTALYTQKKRTLASKV